MNIEQVKQFIKEVRWGFLATTDGRPQCLSVFLSMSVRVYEILRRYIEDESADLVHLDPPYNTGNDQLKTNTALQMESAKIEFKLI
jgi:16S rRNA G966 N2-methylase RsmD